MTKTQNSLLNTPLRSPVTFLGAPRNPVPEQEIPPLPTPRVSLGSQRLGMKTTPLGRSPLLALPAQPREKQPLQRVDLQKQSVGLQTLSLAPMELSATPMPTQKLKPMKSSSSRLTAKLDSPSPFSPKSTAKLGPMKLSSPRALKRTQPLQHVRPSHFLSPLQPSSPRVSRETVAESKQGINDRSQAPVAQGVSVAYLEYHSRTIGETQSQSVAQDAPIAHLQPSGPSMPLVSERRLPLLGQYIELHPIAAVQHPVARRKSRKC